jgi:arylsulfatase A-like enzyme
MDLFPTFCQVAGIDPLPDSDGISLLPTLLGKEQVTDDRTVFWMRREGNIYGGLAYYAARHGDYKLVQNTPYEAIQYFHLGRDELEAHPADPASDKKWRELRLELQRHIQRSGRIPWQKPNSK